MNLTPAESTPSVAGRVQSNLHTHPGDRLTAACDVRRERVSHLRSLSVSIVRFRPSRQPAAGRLTGSSDWIVQDSVWTCAGQWLSRTGKSAGGVDS
jgi:hypothetical protein